MNEQTETFDSMKYKYQRAVKQNIKLLTTIENQKKRIDELEKKISEFDLKERDLFDK